MSTMAATDRPRRPRRQFTDEFKAGAGGLVLDEGKSVGQVARELDSDGVGSGSKTGRCVVMPGGTFGGLRSQFRTNKRPATDRTPPMPMAWSWSPPVAY